MAAPGTRPALRTPQGASVSQDALEPFRALMAQADARIELARACLMIARDAYPALDPAHYLGEIDRYALARHRQCFRRIIQTVRVNLHALGTHPADQRLQ